MRFSHLMIIACVVAAGVTDCRDARAAKRTIALERESLDQILIQETFDALVPGSLPAGWSQFDRDSGYCAQFGRNSTWQIYRYGRLYCRSGVNVLMNHYNDGGLPNDDWLILPQFTLSGTIRLVYWVSSQDGGYRDSYEVRVSTTGDRPEDFTDLVLRADTVRAAWRADTVNLSAYSSVPFRIAFHHVSADGFVLKIDDLKLETSGGWIRGTVRDASRDSLLNGVRVELLGENLFAVTSGLGQYFLNNVAPGNYVMRFLHPAYNAVVRPSVVVNFADTAVVNTVMLPLNITTYNFTSQSRPDSILDFDTARVELRIDSIQFGGQWRDTNLTITDLDVTVNLAHTYDGDLDLWLTNPFGRRTQLVRHNVNVSGNNMSNCRFDDEAYLDFLEGTPPYSGRWRPREPLAAYDGTTVRGNWALDVYDNFAFDVGLLQNFTLHVSTQLLPATQPDPPLVQRFEFGGNFPNPFNARTTFRFTVARPGEFSLVLHDLTGRRVAPVASGWATAGENLVHFDAGTLPSGLYLARLFTAEGSATRKIVALK